MGRKYIKETNRERDAAAIENALQEFREKGGSVRAVRDRVDREGFELRSYSDR